MLLNMKRIFFVLLELTGVYDFSKPSGCTMPMHKIITLCDEVFSGVHIVSYWIAFKLYSLLKHAENIQIDKAE